MCLYSALQRTPTLTKLLAEVRVVQKMVNANLGLNLTKVFVGIHFE